MFVIVGLGNPGREYEKTRHNMGFMTLDVLAARHDIAISRQSFRAYFGEGFIGGKKVLLAKPDTFMNNSGWAVRDIVNWYKIEPAELILIYDDADIPEGYIRVREGGSAGTHNGMRSVVYQLGFDDFPRVRIGIGNAQYNMIQHVLTMPQGERAALLKKAIGEAADAVELIVAGQLHEAQMRFNRKPPKPPKPSAPAEENDKTEPQA
ncbi:MAG: aminoacyl-tRNA hydrolase [Clostridia bacterium]|nr:aminoacyl-tRNA hydrolase [Clostridia bacterium]